MQKSKMQKLNRRINRGGNSKLYPARRQPRKAKTFIFPAFVSPEITEGWMSTKVKFVLIACAVCILLTLVSGLLFS